MGKKKGYGNAGAKDKFEALDDDFKTAVQAMSDDDIRRKTAETAFNQQVLEEEKAADQHLKEVGEVFRDAGAVYRDGTKLNKLRVAFCKQVLGDRGKL